MKNNIKNTEEETQTEVYKRYLSHKEEEDFYNLLRKEINLKEDLEKTKKEINDFRDKIKKTPEYKKFINNDKMSGINYLILTKNLKWKK